MAETRPITPADIARRGFSQPFAERISPDGRFITYHYSPDRSLVAELWAYEVATGREWRVYDPPEDATPEGALSREEQLRRERQRQHAAGVSAHTWSERGDTLLMRVGSDVLVRRGVDGETQTVGEGGVCLDPRLNPDGRRLAFVRDGELHVQDLDAGTAPVRLTHDASKPDAWGDRAVTNGLAEFVAQEEMGRAAGFWWSPDGARLAFEQVDSSPVPPFLIAHQGTERPDVEAHRYPFAGEANVRWQLGVLPVTGGDVTWLPVTADSETYLARVYWTPDGEVIACVEARDQRSLEVVQLDPATGERRVLWTERAEPWVNLHDDLRFVRAEGASEGEYEILWSSERTGRREVYVYGRDGGEPRQLSQGGIFIDGVAAVDVARGHVYVHGWDRTPVEQHLFRIPLTGGSTERVTEAGGMHGCTVAPKHDLMIDRHSSIQDAPSVTLRRPDGTAIGQLQKDAPPNPHIAELDLPLPELRVVRSRDGVDLHQLVYHPRGLAPGANAPVIVMVYGGPHAQMVQDSTGDAHDLRAQYFAQQGYLVVKTDNRGSARRGLEFEGAINRNAGDVEVRDQVDGVRALAELGIADLSRVGVYGWSYGGYMALMCLARAPETFHAAVAGAPVTDWAGYDTHYTERYMGTPANNPEGYRSASVMTHVPSISGKLLIVHGMIDENVHFRHTGRLIQALIDAAVPYEIVLFPEERHGPRKERDRVALEKAINGFFARALGGERDAEM